MELFILCLKIFLVRILDVSLGTFRTIITIKGKNFLASVIGFIEVFVWFVIVKEALNTESTSIIVGVSYALGFATGTYLGGILSDRYIKGTFGIQVITANHNLISFLKKNGFGLTAIDIISEDENIKKYMLFIEIDKSKFDVLKKLIKQYDQKAFIVVNETKQVYNGYFSK